MVDKNGLPLAVGQQVQVLPDDLVPGVKQSLAQAGVDVTQPITAWVHAARTGAAHVERKKAKDGYALHFPGDEGLELELQLKGGARVDFPADPSKVESKGK
jgi:hypothetical protein